MPEGIPSKLCFVGMFDIIGFRELRNLKGTDGLHTQFVRGILPGIAHSAAGKGKSVTTDGGRSIYVPDFTDSRVKHRFISDTVIFSTDDDSFESFVAIIHSAFMLLQFGFNSGKAPYRGAIGWGDLIDDPDGIFVGSAIEDAYVGEQSQAWAGVMLTDSCNEFAKRSGYIGRYSEYHLSLVPQVTEERHKQNLTQNARRLVEYNVPTQRNPKDGPVKYDSFCTNVIDWTIRMYEGASEKAFHPPKTDHHRMISENTKAFEDWARART